MKRNRSVLFGVLCTALLLFSTSRGLAQANARPPTQLSYQGFLTDANGTPFGNTSPVNKTVIFRIYDVLSGGTSKWTAQQVVTVDKGYFSVLLGQGSAVGSEPFNADLTGVFAGATASDRFLELNADGATIAPRIRFLPSPYSMLAKSATELLDPVTGLSSLGISSGNVSASGINASGNIIVNGRVGIGQSSPGYPLSFADALGDKISLYGQGSTPYGFGIQSGLLQIHTDGSGSDVAFGYGSSGNMTETMRIRGNGNVGIGTIPGSRLHVAGGDFQLSGGNFLMDNDKIHYAKNSQGSYEPFLWPRHASDVTYLNYGSGGFNIRNNINNSTMFMNPNGNVGIGQESPGYPLSFADVLGDKISLWGQGAAFYGFGVQGGLLQIHTAVATDDIVFGYGSSGSLTSMTETMRIQGNGKVGIGTTSPVGRLHISEATGTAGSSGLGTILLDHENAGGTSSLVFRSKSNRTGADYGYIQYQDNPTGSSTAENAILTIGIQNDGDDHIALMPSGNVGIGTTTPGVPLDVVGTVSMGFANNPDFFENGGGLRDAGGPKTVDTSIRASGWVGGAGFIATSDRRIKDIVKRTDPLGSLGIIRQLQITDYRMVDKSRNANQVRTGFIAQEVKSVIPDAVSASHDIVPTIYSRPASHHFDEKLQMLTVAMTNAHNLNEGDIVRIFTEAKQLNLKVQGVPSATNFVVSMTHAPARLFVYGKEVDDFLSVDYNTIFTTGMAAIQELATQVDQQAEALRKSEARIAELEQRAARLTGIESELAEMKKLLANLAAPRQDGRPNAETVAAR